MSDKRINFPAILAFLLPLGSAGASTALAAAASGPADTADANPSDARAVAGRLRAIRAAVSEAVDDVGPASREAHVQKAWWGNWHPGWRNGGWGWHNGGWGWRNGGWPNWRNGWHNGGWGNFWRNW